MVLDNLKNMWKISPTQEIALHEILTNGFFAILIIVLGIVLGKLLGRGLSKIFEKTDLTQRISQSFSDLFVVIAKWCIYIIFIAWGLRQLEIPQITNFLVKVLINIPALVVSLLLIFIGFAIASFLNDTIKKAKITRGDMLSKLVFYFLLFVFGIYALRIALLSFDSQTVNYIIISASVISLATIGYITAKKETQKSNLISENNSGNESGN